MTVMNMGRLDGRHGNDGMATTGFAMCIVLAGTDRSVLEKEEVGPFSTEDTYIRSLLAFLRTPSKTQHRDPRRNC